MVAVFLAKNSSLYYNYGRKVIKMSVQIPEKYFTVFYAAGRAAEFPAGANVFMQGDAASDLFLITKGRVRAFALSPAGKETTLEVMEAGRIFGELALLSGSFRSVSIMTVTDCQIVTAPTEKLLPLCLDSEELTMLIFRHMADTCNYLTHQISRLVQYDSVQKVADLLLCESESRGCAELPYTHQEIADSVSLNRVTVSRILSDFKEKGWIDSHYGSVSILSPGALRGLLP